MYYLADSQLLMATATNVGVSVLPEYPGVDPVEKELEEWWKATQSVLDRTDHGHYDRGEVPPRLEKDTALRDVTAIGEKLALPATTEPTYMGIVRHNAGIEAILAENEARKALVVNSRASAAKALASLLADCLRPTAELLLLELQAACPLAGRAGCHDGYAMLARLRALRTLKRPQVKRSSKFHEQQWEAMRDSALMDGCSSQVFAEKVNVLLKEHRPHFKKVRLDGEDLAEAIIDFMPKKIGHLGRALYRELEKTFPGGVDHAGNPVGNNQLHDHMYVVRRCTELVSAEADEGVEEQRMAAMMLPAGPSRVAALNACAAHYVPPVAAAARVAQAAAQATAAAAAQTGAATAKAAAKVNAAAAQAKAGVASKRQQKKGERAERGNGRLPEGEYCSKGSCGWKHDEKYPGKPCYRDPDWKGPLPKEIQEDESHMGRILDDRRKAGERLGKRVQPLSANAVAVKALLSSPGLSGIDEIFGDEEGHDDTWELRHVGSTPMAPLTMPPGLAQPPASTPSDEELAAQGFGRTSDGKLCALCGKEDDQLEEDEEQSWVEDPEALADIAVLQDPAALSEIDELIAAAVGGDNDEVVTPAAPRLPRFSPPSTQLVPDLLLPMVPPPHPVSYYVVIGGPMHGLHQMHSAADLGLFTSSCARAEAYPRSFGAHRDEAQMFLDENQPQPHSRTDIECPDPPRSPYVEGQRRIAESPVESPSATEPPVPAAPGDAGVAPQESTDATTPDSPAALAAVPAVRMMPTAEQYLALAIAVLLLLLVVGTVLAVGMAPGTLVPTMALVTAERPQRAMSLTGAAFAGVGETAAYVRLTASSHPIPWTAALMLMYYIGAACWTGGALVAACHLARAAVARARRTPGHMRGLWRTLAVALACLLVNALVGGVNGEPTAAHLAAAHAMHARLPNGGALQRTVDAIALHRHNLAFMPQMLSHEEALELGGFMGFHPLSVFVGELAVGGKPCMQASVADLCMVDTGAGVDASNGTAYEVPKSRRPNTLAVSTANGVVVPKMKNDMLIPYRRRDGTRSPGLRRNGAVVLEHCPHTLISGGKMAAEEGVGVWVAPYDQMSCLKPDLNNSALDIPLLNVGVLVLPGCDVPATAYAAHIVHGRQDGRGAAGSVEERTWTGRLIHNTFNHRGGKNLRRMCDVSNAPPAWRDAIFDEDPCDDCMSGVCKRVHSKAHAPVRHEPGHFSIDGWENSTPHVHGGQRLVWGATDAYSRLNRSYLCARKSEHADALDTYLTWSRAHGVSNKTCNADNAPDLIRGRSEEIMRKNNIHVTSCAPYDPKGNSTRERQWQTQAGDASKALAMAGLPDSYWWYAYRDAERKSWCIPHLYEDGVWSCPWTRFTNRRANANVEVPFGCLGYVKEYHPASKTSIKGLRCICLMRSDTQPAWVMLEPATGKIRISPHVHFVPDCFPGLKRSAGGEEEIVPWFASVRHRVTGRPARVPQPQQSRAQSTAHGSAPPPPAPLPPSPALPQPQDDAEPQLAHDDDNDDVGDLDAGDTAAGRLGRQRRGPPPSPLPPPADVDGDEHDEGTIAERLGRHRMQPTPFSDYDQSAGGDPPPAPHPHAHAAAPVDSLDRDGPVHFDVPSDCDFLIYLASGRDRDGSVARQAAARGIYVLNVDLKEGGYGHDLTSRAVIDALLLHAAHPRCRGVFASVPCGSWSVLRYRRPGPPVVRRLPRWQRGIPRDDGTLPDVVVRGNAMLDASMEIMEACIEHGGFAGFESPVSRSAGSPFAMGGREDHASMWADPFLIKFHAKHHMTGTAFDQCRTRPHTVDGLVPLRKTTYLSGTPALAATFRRRFGPLVCDHRDEHESIVNQSSDEPGGYASEITAEYSSVMNGLLVDSFEDAIEVAPAAAAIDPTPSDPMSAWGSIYENGEALRFVEDDVPAMNISWTRRLGTKLMTALLALCPTSTYRPAYYETGIEGMVAAMPREEFAGDNPTFGTAMKGGERYQWMGAMDREMMNFENHDVYTEVTEDSLPTWNRSLGRATEVTNTLWVLRKKRDGDSNLIEGDKGYKGRCVVDGRAQKEQSARRGKELETFMPTTRGATHKLQCANCTLKGRRKRQFDINAAYMLGTFEGEEAMVVRPPPNGPGGTVYRKKDARGINIVWKLRVPLYGEADAGAIFHRTLKKQLVRVQKFNQSEYDPCYFYKILADGSWMDMSIHVDDAFVTDDHSELANAELDTLHKVMPLTLHEIPKYFLGSNIDIHSEHEMSLNSRAYVQQMAETSLPKPLATYPVYDTPATKELTAAYEEALQLKADGVAPDPALLKSYPTKVGKLIFAAPSSRVDAAHCIGICARTLTYPTARMDACADRCIAYLAQHPARGVTYSTSTMAAGKERRLDFHGYVDSDWGKVHSTTGFALLFGGGSVAYQSKRQQSIALSSTEAEIMAASQAAAEIIYLRGLLGEMGVNIDEPTELKIDNAGAIELAKDRRSCQRSRHIERRYLKIRVWVAEGRIRVTYVPTAENAADMLTKPLSGDVFDKHRRVLSGGES